MGRVRLQIIISGVVTQALILGGLLATAGLPSGRRSTQAPNQPEWAGEKLERELVPGQAQLMALRLNASEFLRLEIRVWCTGVFATVLDPTGSAIAVLPVVDENPTRISLVSIAAGTYHIRLTSSQGGAAAVRIELQVAERRPVQPADRLGIAIERNLREALLMQEMTQP